MYQNGSIVMSKNIIITGGLGYIGSHTILELGNYLLWKFVMVLLDDILRGFQPLAE